MVNFFFGISEPLCKPIGFGNSNIKGLLEGPTWQKSRAGAVLLANRRYDGSRSRKTKGSLADTFQCNIWRRAQTPYRLTHCLHGCAKHYNGFTAMSKTIGTSKSTESDLDYVVLVEHSVLKFLRGKIACYLHDFRSHWFHRRIKLPPTNGRHDQLHAHHIRRLMRRVQQRSGPKGGGHKRPEIQVFSRLDIGHQDFFGVQFVNCRPFRSHHDKVWMDTLSIHTADNAILSALDVNHM